MLKRIFAATAVLALVALPLAAQAGKMAAPGKDLTITGQVKIGRASCRERV